MISIMTHSGDDAHDIIDIHSHGTHFSCMCLFTWALTLNSGEPQILYLECCAGHAKLTFLQLVDRGLMSVLLAICMVSASLVEARLADPRPSQTL